MKKEVESLHGILDEMFEMSPEMVFEIEKEAKEKVKAARLMMVALWVASFALLFGSLFLLAHFQLMDYLLFFPLVLLLLSEPLKVLPKYLLEKEKALSVLQRRDPVRYKDAVRMQYSPMTVRFFTFFACILVAFLIFSLFRQHMIDFVLSNEIAYGFIIFIFSLICIAFSRFMAKKEEIKVFGMKL